MKTFLTADCGALGVGQDADRLKKGGVELQTNQVRVLELLNDLDVVELDVQELIDGLKRAPDADVVLQLDRHLVIDQRLEKAGGVARRLGQPSLRCLGGSQEEPT